MQKVIFARPDGGLSIVTPAEGARLALSVTLGNEIFENVQEGERVAQPVDQFLRRWPVEGAVAEWAESEPEFVERIRATTVPRGTKSILLDDTDLPEDRATRDAWRLVDGAVAVDRAALPRIIVSRLRIKLTLAERGTLAAVESAVAQAGPVAQMYWADAKDFESDHPLVARIGAAINLDASGIRELFEAARDRDA